MFKKEKIIGVIVIKVYMFLRLEKPMFLLTKYVGALQETKMGGRHFYLGACTQGKMDASHRRRTEGPTHTAGGFFLVFFNFKILLDFE